MEKNQTRPASLEIKAKVGPKLRALIEKTRVAIVNGDYDIHEGKYEKGQPYMNKIIRLIELDYGRNGELTEQDIQLNCNWNNGIAARLPRGGLRKGDVLFGFDTCDAHFEDGPPQAIFPGKMGVVRHTEKKKKTRNTAISNSNPVNVSAVMKLYRKSGKK